MKILPSPYLRSGIELVNSGLGESLPGILSSSPQARISEFQRTLWKPGFHFDPQLCFSSSEYFEADSANEHSAWLEIVRQHMQITGIAEKLPVMIELQKKLGISHIVLIDDLAEESSYEGLIVINGDSVDFFAGHVLTKYIDLDKIVTLKTSSP